MFGHHLLISSDRFGWEFTCQEIDICHVTDYVNGELQMRVGSSFWAFISFSYSTQGD